MDELLIKTVRGAEVDRYIPDIARLRIQVFRDYPYLYDGDADYEARYLQTYRDADGAAVVLAMDGDTVVGASTTLPLREETDEVIAPFLAVGMDPRRVLYLGESVLLSAYRGQGIGVRFFEEREAHGRRLAAATNTVGPLEWFAFCAVERTGDHPRRPADYVPLDVFWQNRGYRKRIDLRTSFAWKDVGEPVETDKPMVFWLKPA